MEWLVVGVLLFALVAACRSLTDSIAAKSSARALIGRGFDYSALYSGKGGADGIALAAPTNHFAITSRNHPPLVLEFRDLVAVEVSRNGSTVTSTNRGHQVAGAAVGALVLGPAGLLLGGLTGSRQSTDRTRRLSLKIYIDDLNDPVHEIVFLNAPGSGFRSDSPIVKKAAREMDQWYGRLQAIIHRRGAQSY